MMSSKALILLGLMAAMLLTISSEARELAETSKETAKEKGLNDEKIGGGFPGGGYRGGGYRGGGYPGRSYPGRGYPGGGYPGGGSGYLGGRGGSNDCDYGCCGVNCSCCASAAEAAQYAAQVKPQN